MVMAVRLHLIARHRARMTDFAGHCNSHKGFQHAINRGLRNLRHSPADIVKDLVGGRVILSGRQNLQNYPPLHGER